MNLIITILIHVQSVVVVDLIDRVHLTKSFCVYQNEPSFFEKIRIQRIWRPTFIKMIEMGKQLENGNVENVS